MSKLGSPAYQVKTALNTLADFRRMPFSATTTGAFLGRRFQIYLCRIMAQGDWFCQSPASYSPKPGPNGKNRRRATLGPQAR